MKISTEGGCSVARNQIEGGIFVNNKRLMKGGQSHYALIAECVYGNRREGGISVDNNKLIALLSLKEWLDSQS